VASGSTADADTAAPVAANLDTARLAEGLYELRAQATDAAGNTGTSAIRTTRVDNTAPTGALTAPSDGTTVGTGATTVTAGASDGGSGVGSVTFQFRVAGSGLYTDIDSETSAPYQTSWTPPLTGSFELRVRGVGQTGNALTSRPISGPVAA